MLLQPRPNASVIGQRCAGLNGREASNRSQSSADSTTVPVFKVFGTHNEKLWRKGQAASVDSFR
jgi:hypothetical protein